MESNATIVCVRAVYQQQNRIAFEHFIQGNQITLDFILDKVNLFIASQSILDFLDIEIKTEENWVDIMDIFGSGQQAGFYIQYYNMKPVIQIKLRKYTNEAYEREKKMRLDWQKKVKQLQLKSESIQRKILLDAKKMEDDDTVDLAFLYAEPLVQRNTNNKNLIYKKTQNDRVSFYQETQKILNTLSEKGFTRSLNIEIKPATVQNLKKILNSGVKILHFACHGNQNTLQIQSQKIGISYQLKAKQLIQLLKEYKLPSIIVFNVCKSSSIAKEIHEEFFMNQKKNVATVGYKVYIENKFCQMFAQNFYPNIFNSLSITKSFEKTLQIVKNDNIELYNKEQQRIAFQSTKIKEFKKELVINDTINRDEVISKMVIYKEKIYNFINKFNSESIINLYGCPKTDKSIFIAKSISYYQERDGVSNCLLLNLKDKNHRYIKNIVQFQCRLEEQIRNKQLQIKSKLTAIVIDHCDCLIELQPKQFFYHLKRFRRSNQCIVILVTCTKIKIQENQDCDMPLQIRYERMCEEVHKSQCKVLFQPHNQIKQKEIKQAQNDILSLIEYTKRGFSEKLPNFFRNLPLVSIFNDKFYQYQTKNYQTITSSDALYVGQRASKHIFLQTAKLIKGQFVQKQSIRIIQIQLNRLLSHMYIVAGSQILLKMEKKVRKQEENNILTTIHTLLNTCIIILNEDTIVYQTQIFKQFKIFKIKIYFTLSHLFYLEKELQLLEILGNHLRRENDRQINLVNHFFGIDLLQLLKLNMRLQNCIDYPSNNWDLWREVFEKANQLLSRRHFEVINIDLLLLHLINPIRDRLVEMNNRSLNETGKKQCKELSEFQNNYSFLESCQTIFWPLYRINYPYYIEIQFQLLKVRLQDEKQFGYTCKLKVAEQLESWSQRCKNQDIQNKIIDFKKEYFNIFPAFLGFHYKKYFRFTNAIEKMLLELYTGLNKSILLKYELFREDNQARWAKSMISIPIAIFAIDIIVHHKPRDHRFCHSSLYVLIQRYSVETKQCFEEVDIKKIKFPDCKVAIFFGQNVSQIKKQQYIYKKFDAVILFDCKSQSQSIKFNLVPEETRQDQVKQLFDIVLNGIITREVLRHFYLSFCLFMFDTEEKYENREDQIYKSFFNAKLRTRYKCIKNSHLYHEKINKIVDEIELRLPSHLLNKKKPLSIGKNMDYFLKDFNILRSEIKRPSKKKRNQFIYNIDEQNEIGYNEQLSQILSWMCKPREKYLILVCHLHEEENFFYVLCRRIRSMGLFKIQWISPQSARKQSIAIQSLQASQSSLPVLQILDLSEKQMKQGEKKMEEKIEFEEGSQPMNKKIIFVFKSFSNLHKQIQKISIRRTNLKTLIGLLSNKIFELKNKRSNSREWEFKFIKDLTKQINRRKFEMSAYQLKEVNNVESVISSLLKD